MRTFDWTRRLKLNDLRRAASLGTGNPLDDSRFADEVERVSTSTERSAASERLHHHRDQIAAAERRSVA